MRASYWPTGWELPEPDTASKSGIGIRFVREYDVVADSHPQRLDYYTMKIPTVDVLIKRRDIIIADLLAKVEAEDWHGVQDCGSDLREIDAQLVVLRA